MPSFKDHVLGNIYSQLGMGSLVRVRAGLRSRRNRSIRAMRIPPRVGGRTRFMSGVISGLSTARFIAGEKRRKLYRHTKHAK